MLIPGTIKVTGVAGRPKALLYWLRVTLKKLNEFYINVFIIVYKGVPALQKGFFRAQFSMSELVKWETRLHLKSLLISSYPWSWKFFLLQ